MPVDYSRLPGLNGSSVLVEPENRPPPNAVAYRGTLLVTRDDDDPTGYCVEIAITYPDMSDMNGDRAHDERVRLNAAEVDELLQHEQRETYGDRQGAYVYTYRGTHRHHAPATRPEKK